MNFKSWKLYVNLFCLKTCFFVTFKEVKTFYFILFQTSYPIIKCAPFIPKIEKHIIFILMIKKTKGINIGRIYI
jgi:hypothetical protein